MAINLQKGQRVSLDKTMKFALVGLGWDTNRYDGGHDFDLDASVFMLGENGKLLRDEDFVFYNNLNGRDGAVVHTGDNLTGDGDGDDEVIIINFDKIPSEIKKLAVCVTIHDAEARRVVAEVYQRNGEWKFNAVAAGYQGGLEAICRSFGANV